MVYMLTMTLIAAHQFKLMEAINERGNREKIGLWLKENSQLSQKHLAGQSRRESVRGSFSGQLFGGCDGRVSQDNIRARPFDGQQSL